jgi:hypothetical protein
MQRLALVIVALALLLAAIATLVSALRRGLGTSGVSVPAKETDPMQTVAFGLLIALIFYVALSGSA